MIKIAFICVHNSCRSQMAEAISHVLAKDQFLSFSAGIDMSREIQEDANRYILKRYNYDMKANQTVQHISELKDIDFYATMGCDFICPQIGAHYLGDWALPDPSGESEEVFQDVIDLIEENVLSLKEKVEKGLLFKVDDI